MNIKDFIEKTDLEYTTLVGFYGGGNYGDELLLEVLNSSFANAGIKHVDIAYRNHERYKTFHKDYGYSLVDMSNLKSFITSLYRSKNIIIGGGGLWGMDVNKNIFVLSFMLFIFRWLFRKKVYLLGVGYYHSTNLTGHISAFFAGKAANLIFARDEETFRNYSRFNKKTIQDRDIAWYADLNRLAEQYENEVINLDQLVEVNRKTFIVTLRRFQASHKNMFTQITQELIEKNQSINFIVMIMEPKSVDPENYALILDWSKRYSNIKIADFNFNPVALLLFFRKHSKDLAYVGPQFHGIISAHMNGIPFFPFAYDNKVAQLIKQITPEKQVMHIKDVNYDSIMSFIAEQGSS